MNPTNSVVRPFRIDIPKADLAELKERLGRARWPEQPDGVQWERGVPLPYLMALAERWRTFDWRDYERRLNALPQFTTEIDGQTIHFVHRRSPEANALPLVLLHGWPCSFVEFSRMIDVLADPRSQGADPARAFHVIVPSLPGFGFSAPVRQKGWTTGRAARAVSELMRRLGYPRYGVHGGDVGAGVAAGLSAHDPERVVGVHLATDPGTAVSFALFSGDPAAHPALTAEEKARVESHKRQAKDGGAYLDLQATRPQTLAYALTDSPVGQLAWIVEKFKEWTDPAAELPEDAVELDQLLANVSLYWFTRTGASSAHFLFESMNAQEWSAPGPAPMGYAVFGADTFVRKLMDSERRAAHWSEFDRGGHFPAMEVPELLVKDLRTFFTSLL